MSGAGLSDPRVTAALQLDRSSSNAARTVDVTTTGRRSGRSRRIEIWFWQVDGRWYLSSPPGERPGWYANVGAHSQVTLHLKHGVHADLAATARRVTDPQLRSRVLTDIVEDINTPGNPAMISRPQDADAWVAGSPLVELVLDS